MLSSMGLKCKVMRFNVQPSLHTALLCLGAILFPLFVCGISIISGNLMNSFCFKGHKGHNSRVACVLFLKIHVNL